MITLFCAAVAFWASGFAGMAAVVFICKKECMPSVCMALISFGQLLAGIAGILRFVEKFQPIAEAIK